MRGPKRELISRTCNVILHTVLRARFSDAQCGFAAVRTAALPDLLTDVRDDGWFFDTELLVLAQRRGLPIHEVPVDWIDDPDSRVDVVQTALTDLMGVGRLLLASPVVRVAGVGVLSTLAYALLFLLLSGPAGISAGVANLVGLAVTAVGNTAANRRLAFGIRGRDDGVRQHALGFLVFVLALAPTSGALGTLHGIDAQPARWVELTVLVLASLAATVTRYGALRSWVFAAGRVPQRAAARVARRPPRAPARRALTRAVASSPHLGKRT